MLQSKLGAILLVFILGISSAYASTDDVDPQAVVVLLFMFVGLTICCGMMHILSRNNDVVPYTVAVFILGICMSTLSNVDGLSSFKESLDLWLEIDANLILYTFLPVLIFGEAMSLNWHHAQGAFVQSTLLAGPGVVIGALIMAGLTHLAIPEWNWDLCLTFGTILSATDPVAVVSLLKNAGAAPKLTILIVGESLLNDGSAMVLFTLFFNMLQGEVYQWYEIVLFFIQAVLGSPLTGFVGGLLCILWMKNAHRAMKEVDITIQIIVTICTAYLVFFVAQYSFEISGVLACCGAGICLAWLAPAIILSHETMHNVWGFLEWMGNTLIFLIAGLIMGNRTFQHVDMSDWFMMVFFYFALFVIRAVVITLLFPWVSTIGHRCTVKDAVFMAWAGLRGALAIALALIVENSPHTGISAKQSSRFLFYIGGIAALSIVINGTFAQAMLYNLGLIGNESSERGLVMTAIRKRLRNKMNAYISEVSAEQMLSEEEKIELRESCSIFNIGEAEHIHAVVSGDKGAEDADLADEDLPLIFPPVFAESATEEEAITLGMSNMADRDLPEGSELNRPLNTGRTLSNSSARSNGSAAGNLIAAAMGHAHNMSINQETFRIISIAQRGPQSALMPDLLAYVRTVFLELCRVKYWHMIESGKIPRTSHSAKFLLYSVDVGIDDVRELHNGLRDWTVIEAHLENVELYIRMISGFISLLPREYRFHRLTKLLAFLLSRREKRSVYILTSFIEAHEHAQVKVQSFLGHDPESRSQRNSRSGSTGGLSGANASAAALAMEDGADGRSHRVTPEETKVIAESKILVERAKAVLALFNSLTVDAIRAKQRQHMLLAKEVHIVKVSLLRCRCDMI